MLTIAARRSASLGSGSRLARHVTTAQLVRHVDVVPVDDSPAAFMGRSVDLGWGRVYGGQTMAQGLASCQRLAGPSRSVHQFGCHFLRGGDTRQDVRFEAETLQSGRSFTVVRTTALQDATPILAMTASLQCPEDGLEHTMPHAAALRPEWRRPHELKSLGEHMAPHLAKVPKRLHGLFRADNPMEFRPAEFVSPWDEAPRPPRRAIWMRSKEALPDDARVHERLLTYLSDWGMLETALYPHVTALWRPELQVSSLSHSIHFHRPFRLDTQWLCHEVESPTSAGGRGFTLGQFWTEDGVLVASTAQEGLMRLREAPAGSVSRKFVMPAEGRAE